MHPSVQAYWLPKEGNALEEYEDAYHCAVEQLQFAIADGATESSYADIWAQDLVQQFTVAPPPGSPPNNVVLKEWLTPLQKKWHARIHWDRLPWYAEEKARNGAFATLLGLKLHTPEPPAKPGLFERLLLLFQKPRNHEPAWEALAIGDSNLFQIRDDQLLKSFPLEKSEEFNSRPLLLSSNPARNSQIWTEFKFFQGSYRPNDLFVLATDALAKWFLERHEAGAKPWKTLLAFKGKSDFEKFISELRQQSQIRNDDTTVILCHWPAGNDNGRAPAPSIS